MEMEMVLPFKSQNYGKFWTRSEWIANYNRMKMTAEWH